MNSQTAYPASAAGPLADRETAADALGAVLLQAVTTLLHWQERRTQRRQLCALGPEMLKQFGIDPADAYREANKPCWRR